MHANRSLRAQDSHDNLFGAWTDALVVLSCMIQEFLVVVRRFFVLTTTSSLRTSRKSLNNQPTERRGHLGLRTCTESVSRCKLYGTYLTAVTRS